MLTVLAAAVNHAAPSAGEHGKAGLPQLDATGFAPQLFWLAVTFAALYFLLSRLVLPRIGEVIEERRTRIQRDLEEAERLKLETEKSIAGYEQALAEARGKAQGIVGEQRDRLAKEMSAERARVEQNITERTGEAEKRIDQLKERALAQVNTIAGEAVGAIVAKLIGVEISKSEVDTALAKLPS